MKYLALGLLTGFFLLLAINALATETCPDSGGWIKIDSDDLSSYPVEGATDYCFKFGSPQSRGCIGGISGVWPPVVDGKYCGLSHWSYLLGVSPTPTPTPQSRITPTASPSATPTTTPTNTPNPTPTYTPGPTPTNTPGPTATPTPEDEWEILKNKPAGRK